jgi:hypothetical protein
MRLRKQAAALALACAAAAGGAAWGQDGPADKELPPEEKPREVEVSVELPEARRFEHAPDDLTNETADAADAPDVPDAPDASGVPDAPRPPARRAQAGRPAPQRNVNNDQRVVELYRAHFGGQLTKAPYLGVSTSPVPGALRQHLGLPEGVGLVVDFVEGGSPAEAAGLKQYDILTRFDDQVLVNAQQLAVLVRSRKAGEGVQIKLIRGGKEQTQTAKLVEKDVKPLGDIQYWNVPENGSIEFGDMTDLQPRAVPARRRRGEDTMVWRDNEMTLTLSRSADAAHRRLVAVDKSGRVLFEGELDDKERTGLPPRVAAKLKEMESKVPQAKQEKGQPRGMRVGGSLQFAPAEGVNVDASFDFDTDDQPGDERKAFDLRIEPAPDGPIGKNDVLNIDIRDVHGPGVKTIKLARVRDGRVDLPYVGPVDAEGLTEGQLEKKIVTKYFEAKITPNPKLYVRVRKVRSADHSPADHPPEEHPPEEHPPEEPARP